MRPPILAAGVLLTVALAAAAAPFPEEAIGALSSDLRRADLLNDARPHYALGDFRVKNLYRLSMAETRAAADCRDRASWDEVVAAARAHVAKHGDRALILVEGAAPRIWGALPRLESELGARYLSASTVKVTVADAASHMATTARPTEAGALQLLRAQMDRDIAVVKHLGSLDIEGFLQGRRRPGPARNLVVGIEETGLRSVYAREGGREKQALLSLIRGFAAEAKPASVLYLAEGSGDRGAEGLAQTFAAPFTAVRFGAGDPTGCSGAAAHAEATPAAHTAAAAATQAPDAGVGSASPGLQQAASGVGQALQSADRLP